MDQVSLIACTMPDLQELYRACLSAFKVSPFTELDKRGASVQTPGTYAMVLEHINNNSDAINNLQLGNYSLEFVHVTFLIKFDDMDCASNFANTLGFGCNHINNNILLLCGTIRQFRDIIESNNELYISVLNQMHDKLCVLGFKSLFGMKKGNKDGSFKLIH